MAAYHEAGHAVVALALGVGVEYATVEAQADFPCGHLATVKAFGDLDVADRLIFVLAGGVSARQRFVDGGDARDLEHARLILAVEHRVGRQSHTVDAAIAAWQGVGAVYVRQHWRWIEAVAAHLAQRGRLTGDEMAALQPRRTDAL